jgi:tRNA(Ile)-lysidine synthetase-like protein
MDDLSNIWTSKHTIIDSVLAWCQEQQLTPQQGPIMVALSGGVDSVALIYCLRAVTDRLGIPLQAMSIDHGWRPESGQDIIWCKEFCNSLNIPHHAAHIRTAPARRSRGSAEEDARYARQALLQGYARQIGAQAIALGHHADDQIETFFIRLIRGAGLTGLAGMRSREGLYIRPLLPYSKQELIDFVLAQGGSWLTDSTNTDLAHLRNRIRHILMPTLQQTDARAWPNILKAIAHLQDVRYARQQVIDDLQDQLIMYSDQYPDCQILRRDLLPYVDASLLHDILVQWLCAHHVPFTPRAGFTAELIKLLDPSRSDRCIPFTGWTLRLEYWQQKPVARIEISSKAF